MKSYLYIIYSRLIDRYYIGYSSNPWIRLNQHNTNTKDKYTSRSTDWELKSIFQLEDESVAIQLERFIKKQKSRNLIERMCQPDFVGADRLAQLIIPYVRDAHAGLIRGSHSVNTELKGELKIQRVTEM